MPPQMCDTRSGSRRRGLSRWLRCLSLAACFGGLSSKEVKLTEEQLVAYAQEAEQQARQRAEVAGEVLEAGALQFAERLEAAQAQAEDEERRRGRLACERRFRRTDFSEHGFQGKFMNSANMSAYVSCLYKLRTTQRDKQKRVLVGGVHYPTLLTTHHISPPVSTASSQWCWLDDRGVAPSGLDATVCCDTKKHGPSGMEACWNDHFTFELCCQGDVSRGELPHHFVAPAFDINVGNSVRQVGTFDLGQSYALQSLCKPGDIVVDIGANVGGFTVPLAERVGPDGEVHAFEPFRKVFQHLNANVALNGLTNVFTYQIALGSETKTLDVYTPDLTTWNFPSAIRVQEQIDPDTAAREANLRYEKKKDKIYVRPLDSYEFQGRIRLVKIDVEFMELEVMRGAVKTFREHKPVLWVENEPYFDDPSDRTFVNFMENEVGYTCKTVARLELVCVHGRYEEGGADHQLPPGFHRVFRHLTGEQRQLRLWEVLHEVEETPRSPAASAR
eukprot:TRINITY_DN114462_c0_g1_i1.p1 TRINITY_DN114462_c0_g1~~TRINITY_DN114462_c0_g1_i1.p1  ORF type:complete len:502 (-),score=113.98 TRINITY_DN114462_c0_g1_i1:10-1515(-)